MHIDMNAYFASVEQKAYPHLRGKPLLVCGDPTSRTAVASASYEARPYGIKAGMSLSEAKRLCPQAVVVEGNPQKYISTTLQIINILMTYTPLVEVFSIDEAFLDLSGTEKLFGSPHSVAVSIKERIKSQVGLTCSIGIAPNKLLAKLASDVEKPDGLVEITPEKVQTLLEDLPLKRMYGIGEQLESHLHRMGVHTCGQLGRLPVNILVQRFGVIGRYLHNSSLGIDESPVMHSCHEEPIQSMGHSHTLKWDTYNIHEVKRHILRLSEMVGRRLRQEKYAGKTVSLIIRYTDYTTHSKQKTLQYCIDRGKEINTAALFLLKHFDVSKGIRLIGVGVSNLIRDVQLCMLPGEEARTHLVSAMDVINDTYGECTVTWATLLKRIAKQRVVAPNSQFHAFSDRV